MIVHLSYTDLRNTVHLYKKRIKQQTKKMQYRSGGFEKKKTKKKTNTQTQTQTTNFTIVIDYPFTYMFLTDNNDFPLL